MKNAKDNSFRDIKQCFFHQESEETTQELRDASGPSVGRAIRNVHSGTVPVKKPFLRKGSGEVEVVG